MKKISEVLERQKLDAEEILSVYGKLIESKKNLITQLESEAKCDHEISNKPFTAKAIVVELNHRISTLRVELVELEHKYRVKKEVLDTKTQEQKEWLQNVEDTAKIVNENFHKVYEQVKKLNSRSAKLEVMAFEVKKDKILADQELKNIVYQKFIRLT